MSTQSLQLLFLILQSLRIKVLCPVGISCFGTIPPYTFFICMSSAEVYQFLLTFLYLLLKCPSFLIVIIHAFLRGHIFREIIIIFPQPMNIINCKIRTENWLLHNHPSLSNNTVGLLIYMFFHEIIQSQSLIKGISCSVFTAHSY